MILAVMSYPYHYHITQLAIKHALKHIPNINKVVIVWDDTHGIEPEVPLHRLLRKTYPEINFGLVPWSSIIPQIETDRPIVGNVGQQIIKLHLDLVLDDEFVILDGDTIFNVDIDPANIMYSCRLYPRHSRFDFINAALGLPNYEFWTNPFMYIKRSWLKNFRIHIKSLNGKAIANLFEYDEFRMFPIYEWEIIARYILEVLKLPIKIEYFDKFTVTPDNFALEFNFDYNFVLKGNDRISKDFYQKHGIEIDEELWTKLGY